MAESNDKLAKSGVSERLEEYVDVDMEDSCGDIMWWQGSRMVITIPMRERGLDG